jgi:cytidylate kinase
MLQSKPKSGKNPFSPFVPFAVGGAILGVGAVLASAQDWGSGATWGLGLLAAIAAAASFAIPTALAAPRRDSELFSMGLATQPVPANRSDSAPLRVLVLSGPSGSGKSAFARQLVERNQGWALASCGAFVKDQARQNRVAGGPRETNEFGQSLLEKLGADRFLDAVLAAAEIPDGIETLVIEDVYHLAVFDAIRSRWDHLRFVSAEVPRRMRAAILEERGADPDDIEEVEHGELDHAVEKLERLRPVDRSIVVPAEQETALFESVNAELGTLLAAA